MTLVFCCRELVIRIFVALAKDGLFGSHRSVWRLKNTCSQIATIFGEEKRRIDQDCIYSISKYHVSPAGFSQSFTGTMTVKLGEEVFSSPQFQYVLRSDNSYYYYFYDFEGDIPQKLQVLHCTEEGHEFEATVTWNHPIRSSRPETLAGTLNGIRVVEICPHLRNPYLTDTQWQNLLRLM